MKNKTVFLDRDGTIIEEVNYLSSISQVKIFDFAFDAVKIFNKLGFKVIIITNQSGVARGYFNKEFVREVNNYLIMTFNKNGAVIDDYFFCPHHPNDNCKCRKPEIGLLQEAKKKYRIDFSKSFIIGDSDKDYKAGIKAKIFPIHILTGHGFKHINSNIFTTLNLYTAALIIKALCK